MYKLKELSKEVWNFDWGGLYYHVHNTKALALGWAVPCKPYSHSLVLPAVSAGQTDGSGLPSALHSTEARLRCTRHQRCMQRGKNTHLSEPTGEFYNSLGPWEYTLCSGSVKTERNTPGKFVFCCAWGWPDIVRIWTDSSPRTNETAVFWWWNQSLPYHFHRMRLSTLWAQWIGTMEVSVDWKVEEYDPNT